jgi:hypothetical protein
VVIRDDDLDIPESNREIAIYLRQIRTTVSDLTNRVTALENTIQERNSRFQDNLLSGLLLPLAGGMLLFLLTKGLA